MKITRLLSEGITHIEELPIDEFIRVLQNMDTAITQEKLDGSQLWVGLDDDGKLFTSREGKRTNAERRYSEDDWPKVAAYNQFRAAHAALQAKESEIKRIMRPGDTVEAEVLFGRQPNSVTYGAGDKSYIAFLRAVNDTPDTIADQLSSSLANQQADVKLELVDTSDGTDLSMRSTGVQFQFIAPQRMDSAKLKQDAGIEPMLKGLIGFLKQDSEVSGYTNQMLATLSLNTIPKAERDQVKQARAALLAQLQTDYKLPIKNALLSKAGSKSGLAADDLNPDEDVGIEGIVLRDPSTGKQVKIVDKDVFTAINRFNQSMRGEVQSALNTTDPDAPLESRGGLLGDLRIQIAAALGNRELAKPSNVRALLEPIKGESPEEAIRNLAASMNLEDFVGIKKKILAVAANTSKELSEKLAFFKENQENYRLKLKTGKEIGLSDETIKKTLLTFAEARRNLVQLFDKLKVTKTPASLLAVLYGGSAQAVHQTTGLTEEMLLEKRRRPRHGEISVNDFERKDTFILVNSYMANVMMAMIIYHVDDTIGMRYLRDRKNYLLKSHNDDMSPLNHWGYVIWKTNKPDLKSHVMKSAVSELTRVTKKVPAAWWKFLHMDFSYDKKVTVDWSDHKRTLTRLMELSGLRTERLNTLLDLSVRFGELDLKEQKRALKLMQTFAYRFVPRSKLFNRIRVIANGLKDAKEPIVAEGLLRKIATLSEEGEGAEGAEVSMAPNGAMSGTPAGAISSLPAKIFGGAHKTVMMRRNKNPQFKRALLKFKDTRKT